MNNLGLKRHMDNSTVEITPEPTDLIPGPIPFALSHNYCLRGLLPLILGYCKYLLTQWFSTLDTYWNDMDSYAFLDSLYFYFLILIFMSHSQSFGLIGLRCLNHLEGATIHFTLVILTYSFKVMQVFSPLWSFSWLSPAHLPCLVYPYPIHTLCISLL